MDRRGALAFLTLVALAAGLAPAEAAEPEIYVNSATGEAINGYDPVAYFTEGRPVAGAAGFSLEYKGAPFLFASAENRDLFAADPEIYAPHYGGYCAYAMSKGAFATTVPEAWTIHAGKLYLNYSTGVRQLWQKDIPGHVDQADINWAGFFP
ncbi:MAG: YHS domain-containing protein [Alphaproteobacteria bacterium]|nr:YHS domain-containing protein [Alphaproteobacteria bacterium]